MKQYIVSWVIDIEGDFTPKEAAQEALKFQRAPESTAVFFSVTDKATGKAVDVDLLDDEVTAESFEHMPVTAPVQ